MRTVIKPKQGMTLWFCLLLLFCSLQKGAAETQSGEDPYLLKEDFEDNSSNWPLRNDSNAYVQIEEGKYVIKCVSPVNANLSGIDAKKLNYSANYTIEALIKKTGGMENNSYGIFWAGKDAGSHYRFEITGNGLMVIYACENYRALPPIIGWVQNPAINRSNAENLLSIMKLGRNVHFFINGKYVTSLEGQFYYGRNLGFITQPEMYVEVGHIYVRQGLKAELVDVLPEEYRRNVVRGSFDSLRAQYHRTARQLKLNFMYTLTDALLLPSEADVRISVDIKKGNETVFSDSTELKIGFGEHLHQELEWNSLDLQEGRYLLQIRIQYQDEVFQDVTRFNVN